MIKKKINWKTSLSTFLETVYEPLKDKKLKWAIMGSVASVLQGCDLQPNDIDILVENTKTVHYIISFFSDYYEDRKCNLPFGDKDTWVASKEQPVFEGLGPFTFRWTYSKFKINELFIEITHKLPPDNHPKKNTNLWESGQNVWSYVREITFGSYKVPIIPLEIQIATNFERDFDERIKQIIEIFRKQSFDRKLVYKAIDKQYRKKFDELMR